MSQLKRNQFQLTFLAMAVLSLSACSTTSNSDGFGLGGIGDGLGKLGSKTAELGSDAWEGTKNVLNIGPQDSQMPDEVDLALMEDDAKVQTNQSVSQDVQIAAAEPVSVLPRNTLKPNTAANSNASAFTEIPQQTAANSKQTMVLGAIDQEPTSVGSALLPADNTSTNADQLLDVTHEVADNENLWQIAKNITGDANNWHRIADINNLAPNASVFPGQKLKIPADMVKPDFSNLNDKQQPVIYDADNKMLPQPVTTAAAQATVAEPITRSNEPVARATIEPAPVEPVAVEPVAIEPVAIKPATTDPAAIEPTAIKPAATESAAVALKIPEVKPEAVVAAVEQPSPDASTDATTKTIDALELTVGDGETLWNFSKRTTGDATNWKTIAKKNGFDEKQISQIRPGQKIYVPIGLLRARDANGDLIAKGNENLVPNANIGGVTPKYEQAITAAAAVLTGTNQPAEAPSTDESAAQTVATKSEPVGKDMKIVEAAFQNDGAIKPVTPESLSEEASLAVDSNSDKLGKVMVKGSYYPKAVYNNADFSSSLLMRVSPGTQLLVSKAIGPWLEVKTDKGVGYVHSRDIK